MPVTNDAAALREQVREHYAAAARAAGSAASCCEGPCCAGAASAAPGAPADLDAVACYGAADVDGLPVAVVAGSLGCGNPTAVAELRPGETVLDLGSGGGLDVLLSARRVGPSGHVYGLDMTDEMLEVARGNAAAAGASNVRFLRGHIEAVPLPDASVDVVISNCVVNLSVDKPAVFAEMSRVLRPGGRVGVSDIVAEDRLAPAERAARGDYAGCIAGALSEQEYVAGLTAAGFAEVSVAFTHEVADGLHGAVICAVKPAAAPSAPGS